MAAKRRAAAAPKPPVDPLARLSRRFVPGEGTQPCRLMLIGEGPGREEDRLQRPFIGPSGQLFWSPQPDRFPGILDALHLHRSDFYITNVIKQQIADNKDPNPAEIAHFRPMLEAEIAACAPDIIVTAGGFAARFLLGPDASLDVIHGLPHWSAQYSVPVVPCLHPAAGLHDTDTMAAVYWDYEQAASFIRGEIGLHAVSTEPTRIEPLPQQLPGIGCPLGIDTESLIGGRTWCATVSWAPGVATLIPADDRAAFSRLASWLTNRARIFFMHHALHDIRAMRQFDIDLARALLWDLRDDRGQPVETARLIDTMVLAFERGKVDPQGLKALAYRRLGRKMRSYEDVVGPYQQAMARDYLLTLLAEGYAGAFPEPEARAEVIDGKVKVSKPWSLTRRLERILADYDRAPDEIDLVKRWTDIDDDVRAPAEALCGPLPKADLSHVPFDEARAYACADADMTRRLGLFLWDDHHARDLIRVATVDHGAMPLIGAMSDNGLPAHRQYFLDLGAEMRVLQGEIAEMLSAIVGYPVNPNSSDQVADLVYNVLGLEAVKTTPGGKPSTGKKALQHLRAHPMVEWIMRSREYGKLDDAFCQNIARRVVVTDPETTPLIQTLRAEGDEAQAEALIAEMTAQGWGRVYTDLLHTRVKTGRMASKNPNLLAIPTRTKLGNRVRGGFVAIPGHILATSDLSQMELRMLAHLSLDPLLVDIYNRSARDYEKHERDVHIMTAARIWGVDGRDVQKTWRTATKSANFGIAMGMSGHGLAEQMRLYGLDTAEWTPERCGQLIDEILNLYAGVKEFQFRTRAEARRYGFVTDLCGRRYDLPQARCPLSWIREEALRQSHALIIQGSAQGYFKTASRTLYTEMFPAVRALGIYCEPLLQVHDETIIEADAGYEDLIGPMLLHVLTSAMPLAVPIEAGIAWGQAWGDLEK